MTDSQTTNLPFPLAERREKGYERDAVDSFLARARDAFERPADADAMTAAVVREASFALVRGGYAVAAVDAALGRVEDAFAERERERRIREDGVDRWVGGARREAETVLRRLRRPAAERFDRSGILHYGYDVSEVDRVADRVSAYLSDGTPLTVEQVRQAAFRVVRNGYREDQVDAVLDAVVEIQQAVR